MRFHITAILAFAIIAPCMTGCQSFSSNGMNWKPFSTLLQKDGDEEFVEPVKMVAIWKASVYEKPGVRPTKGFGARVFFYDAKGNPIKTDGEFVVYGFDDSKKGTSRAMADRKYIYDRAEFQSHYSETDLGHSYSFWLPWEKVGDLRKEVSLFPVFKSAGGKVLENKMALAVLPGKKPPEQTVAKMGAEKNEGDADPNVQMAGFEGDEGSGVVHASNVDVPKSSNTKRREATTIRLPKSLSNHMKALGPQVYIPTKNQHATPTTPKSRKQSTTREEKADLPTAAGSHPTARPAFGKPGAFR